ncbi:MAG: DNA polymerase III subunit beta [Lachnospiraceae bacterium]|nr:DNA polymerase III subunit beta [Lachnospiraceae bacterium]
MKIICSKADLVKSVTIAIRAVPVHTTMPILQCILIEAKNGDIRFTTNDMDLGIETHVKGIIEEEGVIAIEAKMFSDIIRKLPDSDITISTDERFTVTITCQKAKFVIGGQSGDEFTALPSIEREESITLSQYTLKSVIVQTIFSIATGEANKMMTGELFEIRDGYLKVASLDGHRISIRRVELKEECGEYRVIVPGKALNEISKILSGEMDDTVRIFFAGSHIMFELEDTIVLSRLIDGEYFGVDQMISTDYETKVSVNKRELLSCIDRASLFVKEGDKKPIIFDIGDDSMKLNIDSPIGSMNEELVVSKEGKNLMIGFNPRYMMDALKVIEDEMITLYMVSSKAPCFIRDEEEQYTYLILPVNFTH